MAQNNPTPPRKHFTLAAKLCANWDITDVRYSLPLQLRPRGGEQVHPTIFVLLFELSTFTEGEVELVQGRLRKTVLRRLERSKCVEKRELTTADVRDVMDWFRRRSAMGKPTGKRSNAKENQAGVHVMRQRRDNVTVNPDGERMVRRSARLAADKTDESLRVLSTDPAPTETDSRDVESIESESDDHNNEDGIPESPNPSVDRDDSWLVSQEGEIQGTTNRMQDLDGYLNEHRLQGALPSFADDLQETGTAGAQMRRRLARLVQLREQRQRRIVNGNPYEQYAEPHKTELQRLEEALVIDSASQPGDDECQE
ncbi:hypothetical protein SLS60_002183 [Paraconiothyrium brasiliense]|uniref:Uncharacterized protein n=1 Tax=Paraconiothyrium brasiliense TaxID=300254 RepID=A0ABR3S2I0_9PLEO